MTAHAESHMQIHVALRDRLARDVAVARGTLDAGADVRRMIEAHVRLVRVPVDALPAQVESFLLKRGDLLDQRSIGRNRAVARHADVDARQPCDRTFLDRLVAVLRALQSFFYM